MIDERGGGARITIDDAWKDSLECCRRITFDGVDGVLRSAVPSSCASSFMRTFASSYPFVLVKLNLTEESYRHGHRKERETASFSGNS